MARIGFDMDGVLYNFVGEFRKEVCRVDGRDPATLADAEGWNFFKDQWGLTTDRYKELLVSGIKEGTLFWDGPTYPGAKQVMDYLHHIRGDEIVIITSRAYEGVEDLARAATVNWLNNVAHIPYDELHINETKHGYDCDIMIDDAPHQIESLVLAGEKAVVFNQPWNTHVPYGDRVMGWEDLREYIDQKFPKNSMIKVAEY